MNIKKFVNWLIDFRWYIVVMIPLITILLATQLKYTQFDGSYRIWYAEDSKSLAKYDQFRAVFGNDDAIIILFHDENGVMNKKALGVIERLTEKLWQTKYIARVDSLTNYQYIHVDKEYPDDILIDNFIDDIDSLTPEQLLEKQKVALSEDMLVNRIISQDAKTTMILGRVTPKASDTLGSGRSIYEAVTKYIEAEKESGYEFHLAGGPAVNMSFSSLAKYDVTTLTPFVILVAMALLLIIFKRPTGMVLTILVVIFTFLIVLSIQVLLGYKLNNFTANMPVFVIAIGIADAMHLYWVYHLARKKGLLNNDAIFYTLEKNFIPILLTSITTAVGFASLGISEIVPVKTLGIATASAALLAFLLTILFVPAALAILNPKIKPKATQETEEKNFSPYALKYSQFIIQNNIKILIACGVIFGAMGLGLTQLKVDSNSVRYFREDVPLRETIDIIQTKLTGPMAYEIVIDSKEKDGIKEPQFMKTVQKFSTELKDRYPDARHTSSLVDVVKKFNEVINFDKTIPEDKNLIAQYLLLYSISLPQGMEINDKMDVNERYLRLSASMNVVDTSLDLEMIAWIESWWQDTLYSAEVNGQTAMFANMQHDITDTLIESILLAIAVVTLLMFFIFKSIKMIPLFIIPNILPVILVLGVMGWLGIYVDIGVAISGAIILGIAIDDTIHFLVKYTEARKKGYDFKDSLAYVIQYAGSAIVLTTVVLSAAFLVFKLSQFMLNANFGMVTAMALFIAVIVDLFLLPAILSLYDGKEKSLLTGQKDQNV